MFTKRTFLSKGGKVLLWSAVLLVCVGMAERRLWKQRCENLIVKIDDDSGVKFITQNEVEALITRGGAEPVLGARLEDINLDEIEARVLENKLVKRCEASRDLGSNLVIKIEQEKPLARWFDSSEAGEWRSARGFYINEEGKYLPLSNRYSAHVILVSGPYFREVKGLNTPHGKPYVDFLRYIREDDFWKAQINQATVQKDGEISMMTTLGDQVIEFGPPENIDSKFRKLRVFYEKVLASDWNRYTRVSIKFRDQVVCE